jgi:hypothetical protein
MPWKMVGWDRSLCAELFSLMIFLTCLCIL